ncbi:MAG: hypothetical protein MIL41_20845 [Hyphomicrobiales bacterium]|jgi:hypothetical protein
MRRGLDRTDFGTGDEAAPRATDTLSEGTARGRAYREFYRTPHMSAERSTSAPEKQDGADAFSRSEGRASVGRDGVSARMEPLTADAEDILRHASGHRRDPEIHDDLAASAQFGREEDGLAAPSFGTAKGTWASREGWHIDAAFPDQDSGLAEGQGRAFSTGAPSNRPNSDHHAQDELTAFGPGAERDRESMAGDLLALSSLYDRAHGGLNDTPFEGQDSESRHTLDRQQTDNRPSERAVPDSLRAPYPGLDGQAAALSAFAGERDRGSTPPPAVTDSLASPVWPGSGPRQNASREVDDLSAATAGRYGDSGPSERASRPAVLAPRRDDLNGQFDHSETNVEHSAEGAAPIIGSRANRSTERPTETAPGRHRTTAPSADVPTKDIAHEFAEARPESAPQDRPGTDAPVETAELLATPFETSAPPVQPGRDSLVGEQAQPKSGKNNNRRRRWALPVAAGLAIASVAAAGVSVPAVRHVVLGLGDRMRPAQPETAAGNRSNPPTSAAPADAPAQISPATPSESAARPEAVEPEPDRADAREASSAAIDPAESSAPEIIAPSSAASSAETPQPPAEVDAAANTASQAASAPEAAGTGAPPQLPSEITPAAAPASTDPAEAPRAPPLPRMVPQARSPQQGAVDHGARAPSPPTKVASPEAERRDYRARRRLADRERRLSPTLDAANAAAERLLASGQIVAARQEFARTAAAGDPRGARGVARTFDERVIGRFQGSSIVPDREKSAQWYRTAAELEGRQQAGRARRSDDSR